jgi:hypothetical protein
MDPVKIDGNNFQFLINEINKHDKSGDSIHSKNLLNTKQLKNIWAKFCHTVGIKDQTKEALVGATVLDCLQFAVSLSPKDKETFGINENNIQQLVQLAKEHINNRSLDDKLNSLTINILNHFNEEGMQDGLSKNIQEFKADFLRKNQTSNIPGISKLKNTANQILDSTKKNAKNVLKKLSEKVPKNTELSKVVKKLPAQAHELAKQVPSEVQHLAKKIKIPVPGKGNRRSPMSEHSGELAKAEKVVSVSLPEQTAKVATKTLKIYKGADLVIEPKTKEDFDKILEPALTPESTVHHTDFIVRDSFTLKDNSIQIVFALCDAEDSPPVLDDDEYEMAMIRKLRSLLQHAGELGGSTVILEIQKGQELWNPPDLIEKILREQARLKIGNFKEIVFIKP